MRTFSPVHSFNYFAMQKPFIPALLLVLLAFGCSKSDDAAKLAVDSWTITYFLDFGDKVEDTPMFAGYTFEFNANDQWIVHRPDGSTLTGKWTIDAANNIASLGLDNPTAPLTAIVGDWGFSSQWDTGIRLRGKLGVAGNAIDDIPMLEFKKQ